MVTVGAVWILFGYLTDFLKMEVEDKKISIKLLNPKEQ